MRTIIFRQRASAELRAIGTSTRVKWGESQARVHVAELRERIKVLERIATDGGDTKRLADEIEKLRDN